MAHDADGVGVEIEVSFIAEKRRIVRLAEDERLGELVIGRCHLIAGDAERLRLAVEGQDIGRVILRDHTGLQATPECPTKMPFIDLRDIERLLASGIHRELGMHRSVVIRSVLAHLSEQFKGRVLVGRYHHFG